ncbi:hypothetical protein ABZX77_05640 [Streptomyces sp. NPDC004237]|uniref:hypothetical protein n=1 Tax=Streptomyces sp. NPDC004237 TaxID=3154455 RepID=UPI0033A08587
MTGTILAGALGAIALIVYLLFRRLRQLSWQLTQLRVERDSERILREIGIVRSGSRPGVTEPLEEPVRRKHHLALYLGGGLTAALMKVRHPRHAPAIAAGTAAATIALGAATLLLITQVPHSDLPAAPPTGEASPVSSQPEPGSSGDASSSSASRQPRAPGAMPAASQLTDDGGELAMGTISNAPPDTTEAAGTPASRSSPSRGSPEATTGTSPSAPSAPAPSATPAETPPLCVDLRVLLELGLCVNT